jgi:hypothetical protein
MDTDMKKVLGTTLGIASTLALALPVYAQTNVDTCPTDTGFAALCSIKAADFGPMVGKVVTVMLIIAAVVSLFFLIWGGIRWVTSSGDKTKVEAARNTIISALVGLIIAFLAYFIFSVVLGFFGLTPQTLVIPKFTK